jgi:allophanate hydrolase subunit 2
MKKAIQKNLFKNKKLFKNNFKNYSTKVDKGINILNGGLYTLVQDFPGRRGYWRVGVSPSGPMDSYSFRCANKIVGNKDDAAALEMTYSGSTIKFNEDTVIALTGANMTAELDGNVIEHNQPVSVKKGQTLVCSNIDSPVGARTYLAIRGKI